MINRAMMWSFRFFMPLMLIAVPVQWLLNFLPKETWRVSTAIAVAQWSILTTCASLMIGQSTGMLVKDRRLRQFLIWLQATLLLILVDVTGILLVERLSMLSVVLPVVLLCSIASLALILSPAMVATHGESLIAAARESARTIFSDWRRPVYLLFLLSLPYLVLIPIVFLLRNVGMYEVFSFSLTMGVLGAVLLMPAAGLAGDLSSGSPPPLPPANNGSKVLRVLVTSSSVLVPALMGTALVYTLYALVPGSLLIAYTPVWVDPLVFAFLPMSPARVLTSLVPAIGLGWLSRRSSGSLWTAGAAGAVYGILITYHSTRLISPLGGMRVWLLLGVSLMLYVAVALVGGVLLQRYKRRIVMSEMH